MLLLHRMSPLHFPAGSCHLTHLPAKGLSPSTVGMEQKAAGLRRRLPWKQKTRLSLKNILSLSFNYLVTVSRRSRKHLSFSKRRQNTKPQQELCSFAGDFCSASGCAVSPGKCFLSQLCLAVGTWKNLCHHPPTSETTPEGSLGFAQASIQPLTLPTSHKGLYSRQVLPGSSLLSLAQYCSVLSC